MSPLQTLNPVVGVARRDAVPRQRQTLTLVAMCLALAMAALDDTVVSVALPSLQASLSISVEGLQWIINAYLLPIACLVLSAGSLGDIYGRRRVFLWGLVVFVAASVAVAFSVSGQMAIAFRLLQGIGAAALLPGSLAILFEAYPRPKERAKAIGIWSGVSGLALIIGPAVGGVLTDTLGWRSIFFLNLPLGALTFWLTYRAVPKISQSRSYRIKPSRTRSSAQLDVAGMGLSALAIASFIALLMQADGLTGRSLLLALVSVLSAITFVSIESASARPMLPLWIFRQPAFATVFVTNAMLMFMLVSMMFLFSLFLQQVQGYSATAAGLRFLPLNAAFIFASLVSGYFSVRFGEWRAVVAGFVIAGTAVFSLCWVQPDTAYGEMLLSLVLVGFGVGFTLSPLTAVGMGSLAPAQSGIAAALMNVSTRLGGALGIAMQGSLFTGGMRNHLQQVLGAETDLSADVQQAVVAEATSHGATRLGVLKQLLGESLERTVENAPGLEMIVTTIHQSFVAGLHSALWMGGTVLFIAAGLSAVYIRPGKEKTR